MIQYGFCRGAAAPANMACLFWHWALLLEYSYVSAQHQGEGEGELDTLWMQMKIQLTACLSSPRHSPPHPK